jgi:hypothetical protein
MGEMRNINKVSVVKSEEMRPLGRPGHTREINIKMNLKEVRKVWINWIHLAWDMNHR